MQNRIRIDPMDIPLKEGESWWVVHPNQSQSEFKVPAGAVTVCTESFLGFTQSTVYTILGDDSHNGWITLQLASQVVEMPYYVFARYFDAEAFIRGRLEDPAQLEKAKPFDYKPTLPMKPKAQIDLFEDDSGPKFVFNKPREYDLVKAPYDIHDIEPPKFASGALQQEEILRRGEEIDGDDGWKGVR